MSPARAHFTHRHTPGLALRVAALVLLVVLAGCTNAPPTPPEGRQPAATTAGATVPAGAMPAAGPSRTPGPSPIPVTNVSIDINGRYTHTTIIPRKVVEVLVTDAPIDVVVHYPGSLNGRETSVHVTQPATVSWPVQLTLAQDPDTVAFQLAGQEPGFFTVQVTAEGYAPVLFSMRAAAPPTPGPGAPQELTPLPGTPAAATPAAAAAVTSAAALSATAGVGTAVPGLGPIASTALPAAGAPGGTRTVTLADAGSTLTLRPGERFVLALGEQYDWQVTVADPAVVSRVVNITPIRGSQGVYEAQESGQTTLNADGEPACRKAQPPCMMPARLFQVQVVVQ